LSSQIPCPSLPDIYYRTKKYTENLLEQALSLAIKTELLPEKLKGSNYLNNKALTSLLNESQKVNRIVDSDPKLWNLLLDGKTKSELARYKRISRDIDGDNKNWVSAQKNKEFFWALTEGCHWLLSLLDRKIFAPQDNLRTTDG
jgi:hypothetical protein